MSLNNNDNINNNYNKKVPNFHRWMFLFYNFTPLVVWFLETVFSLWFGSFVTWRLRCFKLSCWKNKPPKFIFPDLPLSSSLNCELLHEPRFLVHDWFVDDFYFLFFKFYCWCLKGMVGLVCHIWICGCPSIAKFCFCCRESELSLHAIWLGFGLGLGLDLLESDSTFFFKKYFFSL